MRGSVQDQLAVMLNRELGRDLGPCMRCGDPVRSQQSFMREDGQVAHVRCRITGRAGADPVERDARPPGELRCPGPLVALRGLAALYGVSAQRLAACLRASGPRTPAGALRDAVDDALGCSPLTPGAVHYFHAARSRDPRLVLTQGLRRAPTTPEAVWLCLGEVVATGALADWAALRPTADGRHDALHDRLLQAADASDRGPRGWLVCDLLLRPVLYGIRDDLALPALVDDLTVACRPYLGIDLAARFSEMTTPYIVEYRRRPARDGQDIAVALSFVEAALRGCVSPSAVGGNDAHGASIPPCDIVGVRALDTQTEWTPQYQPR